MMIFFLNLAFANPNEETTNSEPVTTQTTDAEFDFLVEKKDKKIEQKNTDVDFDDSEFTIDASLMNSNAKVLVPQADDSFLLPEKAESSEVTALPEDDFILNTDLGLEENIVEEEKLQVDVNSTETYDALMGDLE